MTSPAVFPLHKFTSLAAKAILPDPGVPPGVLPPMSFENTPSADLAGVHPSDRDNGTGREGAESSIRSAELVIWSLRTLGRTVVVAGLNVMPVRSSSSVSPSDDAGGAVEAYRLDAEWKISIGRPMELREEEIWTSTPGGKRGGLSAAEEAWVLGSGGRGCRLLGTESDERTDGCDDRSSSLTDPVEVADIGLRGNGMSAGANLAFSAGLSGSGIASGRTFATIVLGSPPLSVDVLAFRPTFAFPRVGTKDGSGAFSRTFSLRTGGKVACAWTDFVGRTVGLVVSLG